MTDYIIAKYLRLSMGDAVSKSMSIPHQRLMLDEFIEELSIPNATVIEFTDNGYTGTNLNRPGVQEMLDLVRCGKLNCIIVKDFSRFSRDSMESGYYIEQVFPLYGVRFISVSDRYDSADYDGGTGGLDVAFKFLINEQNSRDLSMKIKSAKHILMKNGEHIVGRAIYGYRKNDSGRWEHDPQAAEVVRGIYDMALKGMTTAQIRDKLFADRQPTPREYEYLNKGKVITPTLMWLTKSIFRILTNEQYTGTYIAGKQESSRIGQKAIIYKDRSEWTIIPDSHPPIVSKEDFDRVQEILSSPKEALSDGRERSSHSKKLYHKVASGEGKYNANLYGYRLNASGSWDIDETAAVAIREIYEYALQGYTPRDIAGKLQEAGYVPPGEHFKLTRGLNIQPTMKWSALRIREILKSEQYTGAYVAGKTFQDESGRKYHTPKSKWIIIPDKHPMIVTKETFMQVQEIVTQSKRKMQPHDYLLRGKIVCGSCGRAMIYSSTTLQPMYRCMNTFADPAATCHKFKIATNEVEDAVMSVIKIQAGLVLESVDLTEIRKRNSGSRQLAEYEKKIKSLGEQRQVVYEQFITGEIDRESHRTTKADLTAQLDRLKNMVATIRQSDLDSHAMKTTVKQAEAVLSEALTPKEIVGSLVEKVHVFPNDHIEIVWKFAGFSAV